MNSLDHLDDVAIFLAVARSMSFVAAGRQLGIPQSTVSRRVASLEGRIGTPLLRRTTRAISLTSEGERLVAGAAEAVDQIRATLDELGSGGGRLRGSLNISVPPYTCMDSFGSWLIGFSEEHPDLNTEFSVSDRHARFVDDGVDLSIQLGHLRPQGNVAQKLWDVRFQVVASAALVERAPELRRLRDPAQLRSYPSVITLPMRSWSFENRQGERRDVVPEDVEAASSDWRVAVAALSRGRALGVLFDALVAEPLVPLEIEGWRPSVLPLYAVYPERLRRSPKIVAAIQSMQGRKFRRQNTNGKESGVDVR